MTEITVIGGGLAGCECAYRLLKSGYTVKLYEMRPSKGTPVHKTGLLAELVCSNSLKSTDINTSQGLLKAEMKLFDSFILRVAEGCSVPAGGALAVDRVAFSEKIEKELAEFTNLKIIREEVTELPKEGIIVIATGPLTEGKFADEVKKLCGESMHFYDAVAPIVTKDSVDMTKAFFAGRYGKGGEDYLNLPMNKEEYLTFYRELIDAESVILKEFEKKDVFNACMPIEVMAKRGEDSMRFGPLRPVGLRDPRTGERPYAVVQLRKEDNYEKLYNLVGFQTNLKFGEQQRVFGLIPALKDAEFVRYGVMHRNTFINAPEAINFDFSSKINESVYFGGQISGVEGYLESAMSGLMCAFYIDKKLRGEKAVPLPEETAMGSLIKYITSPNKDFQPMHVGFSLMPEPEERIKDKRKRKEYYSRSAIAAMENYCEKFIKER